MNSSIRTIGYLTILKVLGAVIGLTYSILQVRYFGANATVDAYFVATSAVYLITSLTQGGQLAEVFLPEYLRQKEKSGIVGASALLSAVLNRMVFYLAVILTSVYFVTPWIIKIMGPGLKPMYQALAIDLFRVALLLILFNLIAAFVNATLNAEQIFGRAEITGLINGVISISILLCFFKSLGIWVLIYALLAGKVIEFFIGLFFLKKVGYRYQRIWKVPDYDLTSFFKVLFTTSGYVGATQSYNVILTAMASFLPTGSYSLFNYVQQLSQKTKSIILTPVSTVFFSKFSKLVAKGHKEFSRHLVSPIIGLSVITLLQLGAIILIGEDLLKLLWSEKSLTQEEYAIANIMLVLNFIAVFISSMGMIFRKSAVALGFAKSLYKNWMIVQLISGAYSFVAIYFFQTYGLASIIVVNMFLMSSVSYFIARKSGVNIEQVQEGIKSYIKWILSAFLAVIIAVIFSTYFQAVDLPTIQGLLIKGFVYAAFLLVMSFFVLRKEVANIIHYLKRK